MRRSFKERMREAFGGHNIRQTAGNNSVQIGIINNYDDISVIDNISELARMRRQYTDYIKDHRANIMRAFHTYMPVITGMKIDIPELYNRCKAHDLSKFSNAEYEPYRIHFFPTRDDDPDSFENKKLFEEAWRHHYTFNSHHPEYFHEEAIHYRWNRTRDEFVKDLIKPKDEYRFMDNLSIVEMVFDWVAMGYKFNNRAYEYYDEHEESINKKLLDIQVISKVKMILFAIKTKDKEED